MKTALIVLISIFLILFGVGCISYVVFFAVHKSYFNKELKLMEQYNKLVSITKSLNMYKLDVLAQNNDSVKENIDKIKAQYKKLDDNLATINKNIDILYDEIDSLNLSTSKKHMALISKDIANCTNNLAILKQEYERYTKYSDTISEMFQSYIELNEKITKFYNSKLIYHSEFKKILALFDTISKTIASLPDATVKFDYKKTVTAWVNLHNKIKALVKAIKAVLKFQIIATYLRSSMDKNIKIIAKSYTSIADSDKQILQRHMAAYERSYTGLIKAYRSFDLNKAQAYAVDATLSLNQVNSFVTVHTEAADIIAVSLDEITNQTNTILANKEQILNSINTIQQYFVKEPKISKWFDDIVKDIDTIDRLTEQSKYVNFKTHGQKVSALTSLTSISKNIFNKKEEISVLIDKVNDALNRVITSISDLNDLYIYFWQMLITIKKVSPDDEDTKSIIALIENNLNLINKYTAEIIKQENPDYLAIEKNIKNIIEHVHQVYNKIGTNLTLKNYASKLMVYANRYKSASTKQAFAKATAAYRAKKYGDCIDQLLIICKKAKSKKQ